MAAKKSFVKLQNWANECSSAIIFKGPPRWLMTEEEKLEEDRRV
jgi:hypothetical protein